MDLPEDSEEEDCGDTAKTSVGELPRPQTLAIPTRVAA